jgi:hypothetical protein
MSVVGVGDERGELEYLQYGIGHELEALQFSYRIVEVMYLLISPNNTSVLQPVEKDVIKTLMYYYAQNIVTNMTIARQRFGNTRSSYISYILRDALKSGFH